MSIDQANIRMLRALGKCLTFEAGRAADDAEQRVSNNNQAGAIADLAAANVLVRLSMACESAADDLERNPIRLPGEIDT